MKYNKLFPILFILPLVVTGCGKTSKKKTSSQQDPSSATSEVSPTSEGSPSSSGTSLSPSSATSAAPVASSSVTPASSSTPVASSSVAPASSEAPVQSSSVVPASSAQPDPSSAGTSSGPAPVDPHTAQEYLDNFNSLKASIQNNHNYTIDVHTDYIDNPADPKEEDNMSFDDEIIMINNKVFCWNNGLFGGKSGYIYQKNQGYVSFDYYGMNVLPGKFYSTNTSIGITDFEDMTAENFYVSSYTQDTDTPSIFKSNSIDVMAVVGNMSGMASYIEMSQAPEYVYFSVDIDHHELTMDAHFTYTHFDEVVKDSDIHVTLKVKNIGSTTNSTFESYLDNPTTTYPVRTEWIDDEKELFRSKFAGEVPSFPTGASYAFFAEEYNDYGTYKVLVSDRASGDLTNSYASEITTYEGYVEVASERDSRLFKRVYDDVDNMTRYTHTIELAYEEASLRYPNGRFDMLFKGKTEPTTVDTVQAFNTYLSTKGYSSFVPQLNIDPSISISKFNDVTESKNQELGEHAYEFYTGTSPIRIVIADYDEAVAAVNSYTSLFETYGFTSISKDPIGKRVNYTNTERYKTDSSIILTDLSKFDSSTYLGFIEVSYQIYAEKDPSDLPTLVKIQIDTACTSDFTVGDTFTYGSGVIRALYSNGNWSSNIASECTFSGYDMSVSGDQNVTVTYTEGGITVYAYYTIHVESSDSNYRCEFSMYGDNIVLELNLCGDGSGTYSYTRGSNPTYRQYFTYVINGSSITFTLTQEYSTSTFTRFSLFAGESIGTTRVGTYDEVNHKITVDVSTSSGTNSSTREFTLQ